LFKRFAPESQAGPVGQAAPETAARAEPFEGELFGQPAKGLSQPFQEFKDPKAASQAGGPALKEGPSLGYLFKPFNPGQPEDKAFVALKAPKGGDYEFKELDPIDDNIINTLDKAEKKAKAILAAAEGQEREFLAQARKKAQELSTELTAKAQGEAAELYKSAEEEAAKIREAAQASVAGADQAREELAKLKADLDALSQEVAAHKAEAAERLASLNEGEARLKAKEEELAAKSASLEDEKKKALSEAAAAGLAEGLAQGQKDGEAKGEKLGREAALDQVKSLLKALAKVGDIWQELWEANGEFMVRLAVEAAEAIVNKEIESGQGLAAGAFKACVAYLTQSHEAAFRICPGDLAELEKARAELREEMDSLVNIKFVPDAALGPGDLVMEADVGRLDATLKTRREKVMTVLRAALAQGFEGSPAGEPSAPAPAAETTAPPPGPPPGPPTSPSAGPATAAPPTSPDPAAELGAL
jgi:flagellar biosynthesis/type III secretory pathway protein FliH/vacuolar-type H+-ATPase subunit H